MIRVWLGCLHSFLCYVTRHIATFMQLKDDKATHIITFYNKAHFKTKEMDLLRIHGQIIKQNYWNKAGFITCCHQGISHFNARVSVCVALACTQSVLKLEEFTVDQDQIFLHPLLSLCLSLFLSICLTMLLWASFCCEYWEQHSPTSCVLSFYVEHCRHIYLCVV